MTPLEPSLNRMIGDTVKRIGDRSARLWGAALVFVLALAACGDDLPRADRSGGAEGSAGAPALAGYDGPRGFTPQSAPREEIDLRNLGYGRGAAGAPVVVYEFADFGCGYCARFAAETYPELHRDFVETGKVRWTYVPFVIGMFPNGEEAARTAECAAEQGGFWEMHDHLFRRQAEWKSTANAPRLFGGYAAELGLDTGRFEACYLQDLAGARTRLNNRAAAALRIRATPTFIINGRVVEGALPAEQFRQILTMLGEAG